MLKNCRYCASRHVVPAAVFQHPGASARSECAPQRAIFQQQVECSGEPGKSVETQPAATGFDGFTGDVAVALTSAGAPCNHDSISTIEKLS